MEGVRRRVPPIDQCEIFLLKISIGTHFTSKKPLDQCYKQVTRFMAQQFTQYSRQMELHELYRELKDSLTHIIYFGFKHFPLFSQGHFTLKSFLFVLLESFFVCVVTNTIILDLKNIGLVF